VTLRLPNVREALVLLVLGAALAVTGMVWARVVHTISSTRPVASSLKATSVVWGDRVFQSRADLTRWLHTRGATYVRWSTNHPAASDLLEHRKPTTHQTVGHAKPTVALPRSHRHPTTAASAGSSSGSLFEHTVVALLALLAVACALAASFPGALQYRYPGLTRRISAHRDVFLAGAAALVIGLVAGVVLS
jgi:hypothetical protein